MQQEGQIGRYRIIRRVGSGGMALTFLCALDGVGGFQKEVVIKILDPERIDDERYVSMFLDEARLWAKLSHPNIPQAFELGEHNDIPYIVMEYVPGPNLHMLSRKLGARSGRDYLRVARVCADIARALDYAYHGQSTDGAQLKVVHRDVTPNNILLSTAGRPYLIDFGIALADNRIAQTEVGTFKGRVQFMAPEQFLDQGVDHRTDLFQLGITLYHLLTGRPAYVSENKSPAAMWRARMEGQVAPILSLIPDCPAGIAELAERCIANNPEDRPARGATLADALEASILAGGEPVEAKDLAAWVSELFPNQEWTASTGGVNTLGTGSTGTTPPRGTKARFGATRPDPSGTAASGGSMPPALQPAPRGRTAMIAIVAGGLTASLVIGLAGLITLSMPSEAPPPPPEPVAAQPPEVDPNRAATVYLDEAERLVGIGRVRDAGMFVLDARNASPKDPEVIVRLSRVSAMVQEKLQLAAAEQALEAGDLDGAAERAGALLDVEPTHAGALALLARVSEAKAAAAKADAPPEVPAAPAKGTLSITSDPPAQVFVDDRPYGMAPQSSISLPVGRHTVYVRLAGHTPVKRSINVRGNDKVKLNLTLEEIVQEPEADTSDKLTSLVAEVAPAPGAEPAPAPAAPPDPAAAVAAVAAVATPGAEGLVPLVPSVALPVPAPEAPTPAPVAPAPAPAPAPAEPAGTADMVSDVPTAKQAMVLARALSFDSALLGRVGDKLVVGSLFNDPATKKLALRMNAGFSNLGIQVQGKSLSTTTVEFTTGEVLAQAIRDQGIDVLYVPSGMGSQVSQITQVARSANVVTIGAEPSYVRSGLSLGVFSQEGKPVLALNQRAAAGEGAQFSGEILQVAVRMD
jgi:serine/threonine protein kinase